MLEKKNDDQTKRSPIVLIEIMACPKGCLNGGGQILDIEDQNMIQQEEEDDDDENQPEWKKKKRSNFLTPNQMKFFVFLLIFHSFS